MRGFDDTGHPPPFFTEEGAYEKWKEKLRRDLKKLKKENQREKAS